VCDLAAAEHLGQHADDFSALCEGRVSHGTHQPAAGSAIDQTQAGVADCGAER
jgi:hypothetical protein